jgi:hypothetical protein
MLRCHATGVCSPLPRAQRDLNHLVHKNQRFCTKPDRPEAGVSAKLLALGSPLTTLNHYERGGQFFPQFTVESSCRLLATGVNDHLELCGLSSRMVPFLAKDGKLQRSS